MQTVIFSVDGRNRQGTYYPESEIPYVCNMFNNYKYRCSFSLYSFVVEC